eukprot:2081058-Amphidinium_carterae.1
MQSCDQELFPSNLAYNSDVDTIVSSAPSSSPDSATNRAVSRSFCHRFTTNGKKCFKSAVIALKALATP